jgi:hypothetical protein
MREITASATGVTPAEIDRCFAHLADVERYPVWYPTGVKRVEVLDRDEDGRPTEVDTILSVSEGPLRKDFEMILGVRLHDPVMVDLRQVPGENSNRDSMGVMWSLAAAGRDGTEITVDLTAHLDLPPFLPVGAIADKVAKGFLAAALQSLAEE